ncbi:VWA domain-containing protein [Pseudohalioglobus sediminis]|uniref:VWA domain-containing protein n=1 Tax=Pseudohalioglobus sediminis TaxID=2606449 RepID=A0A5B0X751_9GAMM|nr:VWA domain-containing protein [Pseudohalioglobus sediminis]KAA1194059.1 VWA domain-containing protein [Pseudohalioglobus sediminis]
MIEWLWPWLLLLAPLPWLLRRMLPPASGQEPALRAPFFDRWQQLSDTQGTAGASNQRLPMLMLWLLWLLLLLAAARPMWVGEPIELPNSGRDLMLAVDISGSMKVEDMEMADQMVSRIRAVKQVASEFIRQREGDRLGLILFGSNAYVQSPLSFDTGTVRRFLLEAQIGFAGQDTAIGDAIGLAVKRLRERPAESRVLVLLSDGRDTASSVQPLDAARLAADLGIRIYTIGIGADRLTMPGIFGSSFGARQVNPSAELDEAGLQEIAKLTGGQYFRARNPAELANIYQLLDQLEPIEVDAASYRPRQALGYIPLLLALGASFALALWRSWRSYGRAAALPEGGR